MEATRKPELVIVDTLKDKHNRTVKVGYRGSDVEVIVTPHSGHDGRIALDGPGRDRFIKAWATAERLAEESGAMDEAVTRAVTAAQLPGTAPVRNKVEQLARDLIGIPDSI